MQRKRPVTLTDRPAGPGQERAITNVGYRLRRCWRCSVHAVVVHRWSLRVNEPGVIYRAHCG